MSNAAQFNRSTHAAISEAASTERLRRHLAEIGGPSPRYGLTIGGCNPLHPESSAAIAQIPKAEQR